MLRKLAIAIVFGGVTAAAQADVYRVVDGQGHVQYTDRWEPGAELVKVDKNRPNPDATVTRQSTERSKIAASNERIASQQADQNTTKSVQADVAKTREEQCKQAKERYQKAIQARRIFRSGKDGQKEYISDADADAYRIQARKDMDSVCGPSAAQ